jgi:hypothetical protein
MFADVSLAEKGHQKSLSFSSSLSLSNPSIWKGNQPTRKVATCSKGGSQPGPEAGRELLSNKVTTCLVSRLWWVSPNLMYRQSYRKASWCTFSARDTNFLSVLCLTFICSFMDPNIINLHYHHFWIQGSPSFSLVRVLPVQQAIDMKGSGGRQPLFCGIVYFFTHLLSSEIFTPARNIQPLHCSPVMAYSFRNCSLPHFQKQLPLPNPAVQYLETQNQQFHTLGYSYDLWIFTIHFSPTYVGATKQKYM